MVGHCYALIVELVISQLSMLFMCMFHTISRYSVSPFQTNFTLDTGEAFACGSIFNILVFCLGEKEGMLVHVSDECNSSYDEVVFFWFQFEVGRNRLCVHDDALLHEFSQTNLTSECEVNNTECYGG